LRNTILTFQFAYGWSDGTVAMMANWGTIMFLIFVIPLSWFIEVRTIRNNHAPHTPDSFKEVGTVRNNHVLHVGDYSLLVYRDRNNHVPHICDSSGQV
jgi:hypothetical protein